MSMPLVMATSWCWGGIHSLSPGIIAHSDGDVLIHALIDAILALALGIGQHFPDTDPQEGADSRQLLAEVVKMMAAQGYQLGNADSPSSPNSQRCAPPGCHGWQPVEDLGCQLNHQYQSHHH